MASRTQLPPIGHGLDLVAVFDVASLPATLRAALHSPANAPFRQLILVAHGGRALWSAIEREGTIGDDPVDDFTVRTLSAHLDRELPGVRRQIAYPAADFGASLQALGALAGWHHPSPFLVGVNARFGSWFAYRAVVLADSELEVTVAAPDASPCDACTERPCVTSCPAGAIDAAGFDLGACIRYRRRPDSRCRSTCIARTRCPVGAEHRYGDAQLQHHYGHSLRTILAMDDEPR